MKIRFALLALPLLVLIIGLSSCTREYICQCTIVSTGAPGLPDTLVNEYGVKDTKKNAKSLCENASSSYTDENSGITTVETCKIF